MFQFRVSFPVLSFWTFSLFPVFFFEGFVLCPALFFLLPPDYPHVFHLYRVNLPPVDLSPRALLILCHFVQIYCLSHLQEGDI